MSSEIRVNSLSSRTGLSTVTFTDTGPIFSGITTFQDNSGFNVGTGGSIFSPASNIVTLGTNNAERFRIDSAGRMLLGTTTEGESNADTLTIAESGNAGITIRSGSSATGSIYFSDATSGGGEYDGWIAYNQNSRYFQFGTAQTERLRITASGSVGIGTDNPDATLKVNVASGNNGVVVQNTSTANIALFGARNGDATVQIGQWGSTASGSTFGLSNADLSFIYTTSYGTTHPSALALGTVSNKPIVFATNNTERVRIDSSGNMQVSTGQFTVGTTASTGLQLINDGTFGTIQSADLKIRTAATERLRITSAGLVGVNCTPLAQFQVKAGTNQNIALSSMSSEAVIEAFNDAGSANVPLRLRGEDFKFYTSSSERLRILSDGKVAIGGVTANSLLDVHGGDGISITHSGDTFLQSRTTGTTGTNYLEFKDSGGGAGAISYHHNGDSMRFKINGAERAVSTLMVICKSVAKVLEVLQEQIPDTLVILLNKATDKKRLLEAYLDKDNQVGVVI